MKPVARPSVGTTPTVANIEQELKAKQRQQLNHARLQSTTAEPSIVERNQRRQKLAAEKSTGIEVMHETKGQTCHRIEVQHRIKLRKTKTRSMLRKSSGNLNLAHGICSVTEEV
jgi:hypothetical protein